jgi:DNA-binding response OmpR family regulator
MQTPETPIRALLVEDDADDYILIQNMLSAIPDQSFELQWVKDSDSALHAISDASHDVCLLDYRLGESTGLELLESNCSLPPRFIWVESEKSTGQDLCIRSYYSCYDPTNQR